MPLVILFQNCGRSATSCWPACSPPLALSAPVAPQGRADSTAARSAKAEVTKTVKTMMVQPAAADISSTFAFHYHICVCLSISPPREAPSKEMSLRENLHVYGHCPKLDFDVKNFISLPFCKGYHHMRWKRNLHPTFLLLQFYHHMLHPLRVF